jgi:hypothetical protein
MTSQSHRIWSTQRCQELDQIRHVHKQVGGTGRGRRWATQQVNHAYVVVLTSHFQGYCRDLHSECMDRFARDVDQKSGTMIGQVVRRLLGSDRSLDRGNPTPENIRKDFARLGVELWLEASALDARTSARKNRVEELHLRRNAIVHQDFSRIPPTRSNLQLKDAVAWRGVCDNLVRTFDEVMRRYLQRVLGTSPW